MWFFPSHPAILLTKEPALYSEEPLTFWLPWLWQLGRGFPSTGNVAHTHLQNLNVKPYEFDFLKTFPYVNLGTDFVALWLQGWHWQNRPRLI